MFLFDQFQPEEERKNLAGQITIASIILIVLFNLVTAHFSWQKGLDLTAPEVTTAIAISNIRFMVSTSIAAIAVILVLYRLLRRHAFFPIILSIIIQAAFISPWFQLHSYDPFFISLFIFNCVMAIYKNMRTMIIAIVIQIITNIVLLSSFTFLTWFKPYDFFAKFCIFMYGCILLLILTHRTINRDNEGQRGLAALSAALRYVSHYVIYMDAKGIVHYISNTTTRLMGFNEPELAINRPILDILPAGDLRNVFADIINSNGQKYKTLVQTEIDGRELNLSILARQLHGEFEGLYVACTDVTDLVEQQKQAREAQLMAEQADIAKSHFLAAMSHEIRTPLNAIIGIPEMELAREGVPDETKEALKRIYDSGSTLLGIINGILDFSKIQSGKFSINPDKYETASVINDTVQYNIMRIGSKLIEFKLEVPDDLPAYLVGDELRIKQILNNLLSNAFKYTEKGQVILRFESKPVADSNQTFFIITVSDTGRGMTEEQLAKLYDEYTRFDSDKSVRNVEGTGLGMTITKNLVSMMDGSINVRSRVNVGTTFVITIPQDLVDERVLGAEVAENLKKFHFSDDKYLSKIQITRSYMPYGRVLLVDDVETNLYVARGLLQPYGLQIETVLSGELAIRKILDGEVYDIIFMDHMMPKMDGIQATKILREEGYTGSIVALTANAIVGQDKVFYANGFNGFISKPIDLRQLNETLNKMIRDKQPPEVLEKAKHLSIEKTATEHNKSVEKTAEVSAIDTMLLPILLKDIKKGLPTIEKVLANIETAGEDDLRAYTINVHGLKSALRDTGYKDISALALALETAGRAQDKQTITADTPRLIDALQLLLAQNEENSQTQDASITDNLDLLHEQLEVLVHASEHYDGFTAFAALSELEKEHWTKETSELLEELHGDLLHSEFENAIEIATKYMQKGDNK